jgi:hypothetical protein
MKSGKLNVLEPSGPLQVCNGNEEEEEEEEEKEEEEKEGSKDGKLPTVSKFYTGCAKNVRNVEERDV